jgi:hypothetical protein
VKIEKRNILSISFVTRVTCLKMQYGTARKELNGRKPMYACTGGHEADQGHPAALRRAYGDRLYQRSPVKDSHLQLCPLCKAQEENIHHFLHCHKNPNRKKSIKLIMVTTILKDDRSSRPVFASCLEQ